jgi:hypothetical protein
MRRLRERLLKVKQLVDFQIGSVREGHEIELTGAGEVLLESRAE